MDAPMSDPEIAGPKRFHDRYRGAGVDDLPWYNPHPDLDLVELFAHEIGKPRARVLDLGAGPAVHSIYLAGMGHEVVALDVVPEARELALGLAAKAGVELEYHTTDVLECQGGHSFDVVFDRGFLHTLEPKQRPAWRRVVTQSLVPDGLLVFKCFDVVPPRNFGPRGMTAAEVVATLGEVEAGGLELHSITRTRFHHEELHATWTVVAHRI